ncbi:hypothetical protein J3459_014007 [Metarhizium acridum]|nr:hypothetical protein J3459_014007 [Metarhizium acridum]
MSSGNTSPPIPQPPTIPSSNANPPSRRLSRAGSLDSQAGNQANQHSALLIPSSPLTRANRVFSFQQLALQHPSSLPSQTCSLPGRQDASHNPVQGQRPASTSVGSCEPGHGDEFRSSMPESIGAFASQSQDMRTLFSIPNELSGSPTAHPGFPISINEYSDIPLAPVTSSESASKSQDARLNILDSMLCSTASGLAVVNPGFDPLPSSSLPTFGTETYSQPPFAVEDDFTAWLFNESSVPSSSVAYPSWTGVIPSYLDAAQLQTQLGVRERTHGMLSSGGISDRPMSVARTPDRGSPRTIMSDDKLQELLHLMATRFNKAAYSTVASRTESFLDGDVNNDNHILSLRMTRTYIESYWYHFHPQLPILHRPAFVADHAPNLLLLAIIAIGASTLDRIHGPEVTETVSELANFIIWHLRWEVFMDTEFQAPTKLWVYQALLLIEVHEKMYSTRSLHDRAHIHHDTTLTLMRRGNLFVGRSADSPQASSTDDRPGSNMTPDSALDESWTHWIKAEATRRVVFAAFVLDSTHAAMFGHPAKMTAHELRLPLPCDEALWSATSAAEVVRVQSSLRASGAKPNMFLDGLKETLEGRRVRTDAFGRSIIMTGLLSVLWHMKQREPQACSLDVPPSLGGRDNRRSALLRAFDDALGQNGTPTFGCEYRARRPPGDNYFTETRGVLHGLAHMASHIDIAECQSFAGAVQRTGQSRESSAAVEKMAERWAVEASAREAAFYALKFLSQCLLTGASEDEDAYSGRDDYNLNRPWVMYMAALVVWCYGFAADGPIPLPPALATAAEQRRDMLEFLKRVGGVRSPHDLQGMRRRNRCLGLLMVLRDGFVKTRWELLTEAANLLDNCIAKLRG